MQGAAKRFAELGYDTVLISQYGGKTNHSYLIKYTDIPWTAIMGLRDIIAHEYHRIDEEEIFAVVNKDLISLLKIIQQMKMDLETIN